MGTLDLTTIKNFCTLPSATQLLFLILMNVRSDGNVIIKKREFADYIKISEQTAGAYLRDLVSHNIIKYKYSGALMVNPDFFFTGQPDTKPIVKLAYNDFKSDM